MATAYRRQQDASPVRRSDFVGRSPGWPFDSPNSALNIVSIALAGLGTVAFILVMVWHFQSTVWSLNALNQAVTIEGGVGIVVTNDASTRTITLDATGLLGDVAGPGITIDTVNGTTTISHTISDGTALLESDPLGPQVQYGININTATANTWQVTTTATFPGTFIPGVVAGDDGQGNAGGTAWSTPAAGVYAFNAHCIVTPSAYPANDYVSASVALSFNATSTDPATGTVPAGGYSTLPLSVGTNGTSGPSLASAVSLGATVHVCSSCLVQVGAPLHLHARLDRSGIGATPTAAFVCHLQVSRMV
jgi:hypothetical protein